MTDVSRHYCNNINTHKVGQRCGSPEVWVPNVLWENDLLWNIHFCFYLYFKEEDPYIM